MKIPSSAFIIGSAVLACMILLGIGVPECYSQSPPVEAPLVREGAFAMKLAEALGLGQPESEAEAESMLGTAGIAPRNGWIADYPVTPDIIGELRDSIIYASQAKTISMESEAALKALENVQNAENISVTTGADNIPATEAQTPDGYYPDQAIIDNYYYEQGPPVVTYYSPPVDYYYLYSWVPYPFWWSGYWFGGYFILNDFHRHSRHDGHIRTISNHFRDHKAHKVFRIDPRNRSRGRTFAGIGAPKSNKFIRTGTKGSGDRIFNQGPGRSYAPPTPPRKTTPQSGLTGRPANSPITKYKNTNPFSERKVYRSAPEAGGRMSPPPAQGGSRSYSPPAGAPSGRGDGFQRSGGGSGRDRRR